MIVERLHAGSFRFKPEAGVRGDSVAGCLGGCRTGAEDDTMLAWIFVGGAVRKPEPSEFNCERYEER